MNWQIRLTQISAVIFSEEERLIEMKNKVDQLKLDIQQLRTKQRNLDTLVLFPLAYVLLSIFGSCELVEIILEFETRTYCKICNIMYPKSISECAMCATGPFRVYLGRLCWIPYLNDMDQEIWEYIQILLNKSLSKPAQSHLYFYLVHNHQRIEGYTTKMNVGKIPSFVQFLS